MKAFPLTNKYNKLRFPWYNLFSNRDSPLHSRIFRNVLVFNALILLSGISHAQPAPLFESDEIFEVTLRGDLRKAFRDRSEDPQYHQATLHYQEGETTFDIPVRVKSRGNFRKSMAGCKYPPLFVNFKKSITPENSVFKDQDKTKLVTPCSGDQYVINEYLVYKLYNLITPLSFRARMVKIIFEDTVKNKISDPYYSYFLEEEKQMAKRNQLISDETMGLRPISLQGDTYLTMAVFQYLIGNTDWSLEYLQNIKLLAEDSSSLPTPVPYDFDHAGIVRAPYAKPAPELQLTSTQVRRYRGYCVKNMNVFSEIFKNFNNLKDDFYAVYEDNLLISDSYKKQTIKFLDKFYETINDPKEASEDFLYPCDPSGTGNVIIKGLNTN